MIEALHYQLTGTKGHQMRLTIAAEYKNLNYSTEAIIDLFRKQPDFNYDICKTQVESADPTKTLRCENIGSLGYCIKTKCSIYTKRQKNEHYTNEEPNINSKRETKTKQHKSSGYSKQGYYEAIYDKDRPAFLTLNDNGEFKIYPEVTTEDETFLPKVSPSEYPYKPYGYYKDELPTDEELYERIRAEFEQFLDLDAHLKDILSTCVMLSYQQEKLRTVPYVFFVGDNESGKTVGLNLFNLLCYRPMMGVAIPPADIYGYLDDTDAPGTILEDEAQGLNKDQDKAKIYKAGYKIGAVAPRTVITQNKRCIKFYRVFCFKACAAEELPRVKGLFERFIFVPMTEGCPAKDWADLNKEDEKRIEELRNMLLEWRLKTMNKELPEVEFQKDVRGRLKELLKPILQVTAGFAVEEKLRVHMIQLQKERLDDKSNTLESHIVKAVCDLYKPNEAVSFDNVWYGLRDELNGAIDDRKPNQMDTPEFDVVTKQKVGYRLREVLGGKKAKERLQSSTGIVYRFDEGKINRIARKYGHESVLKFSSLPSSEGSVAVNNENVVEDKESFTEKDSISETKRIKKRAVVDTPNKVGTLENSRTNCTLSEFTSKSSNICGSKQSKDTVEKTKADGKMTYHFKQIPLGKKCPQCENLVVQYVIIHQGKKERLCDICFKRRQQSFTDAHWIQMNEE
jgi:hypothetical protein